MLPILAAGAGRLKGRRLVAKGRCSVLGQYSIGADRVDAPIGDFETIGKNELYNRQSLGAMIRRSAATCGQ